MTYGRDAFVLGLELTHGIFAALFATAALKGVWPESYWILIITGMGLAAFVIANLIRRTQITITRDELRVGSGPLAPLVRQVFPLHQSPRLMLERWEFSGNLRVRLYVALPGDRRVKVRDFDAVDVPNVIAETCNAYLDDAQTEAELSIRGR